MPSHGGRDGGKRKMFAFPRVKGAEWLQDLSLVRRAEKNQALPLQDSAPQTHWYIEAVLLDSKDLPLP